MGSKFSPLEIVRAGVPTRRREDELRISRRNAESSRAKRSERERGEVSSSFGRRTRKVCTIVDRLLRASFAMEGERENKSRVRRRIRVCRLARKQRGKLVSPRFPRWFAKVRVGPRRDSSLERESCETRA